MALSLQITSTPLDFMSNTVLADYKQVVVNSDIYDLGDGVYPAVTSGLTVSITGATTSQVVQVIHNDETIYALSGMTGYTVTVFPVLGQNTLHVVAGTDRSNTLTFTADNLQTLIYPLVAVLRDRKEEILQAWANGYLSTAVVNSTYGGTLSPDPAALAKLWGEALGAPRISTQTSAAFVAALRAVIRIYQQGAVIKSLEDIGEAAGGTGGTVVPNRIAMRSFTALTPRVHVNTTGGSTGVTVFPAKVALGNRQYNVAYQDLLNLAVPGNVVGTGDTGTTWVVLDPSADGSSGATGTLYAVSVTGEPGVTLVTYEDTFSQSEIMTDTGGTITGLENGKYVMLERPASEVTAVSGSEYSFCGSTRVILDDRDKHTAVLDLGTRLPVTGITTTGLTVQYMAPRGPVMILARAVVTVSGDTITGITELHSPTTPSLGAVHVEDLRQRIGYNLYLESSGFTGEEKAWALTLAQKIGPADGQGRLLVSSTGGGGYPDVYHLSGFDYYGDI